MEITQKLVRSLFTYKDGDLYWKVRRQGIKIDNKAGGLNQHGYYSIRINGKAYLAHRLIFLYHNAYLPKEIDHIDGNRENNLIKNLREVTRSQNNMNRKSHKNCSSIYKGVSWDNSRNKWRAYITINKKINYLGRFTTEKTAAFIYNVYARGAFGEYAYLNNINGD